MKYNPNGNWRYCEKEIPFLLHYKPTLRHDRLSYINCSCIIGLCGKTSIDLMKGFIGIVDSQDYALCTNILKVIEYKIGLRF